ncbi:MAG: STAS domain-containing protein [bacterium]
MTKWSIAESEGILRLTIEGRVEKEGVENFQGALDSALDKNPKEVVFDLKDLEFINSSGIGKLLKFYKRMRDVGGDVSIEGISEDIFTLFKVIGLDKHMKIKK